MRQKASEVIPRHVLDAAAEAGISSPMWYAGSQVRPGFTPAYGLSKVVREARERAAQEQTSAVLASEIDSPITTPEQASPTETAEEAA
jgi:hypothetical protein